MILSPGDDVAKALHSLKSGTPDTPQVVLFKPGDYTVHGALLHGLSYIQLAAQGTVRFVKPSPYALKFENCNHITAQGLGSVESAGHAFFATGCNWLLWESCWSEAAQTNGFLTGQCTQVTLRWCQGRDSKDGHGCYLSQRGSDYLIIGGAFTGNARTGAHLNAHPGHAQRAKVTGADLRGNATASIQVAGVMGGMIAGNQVGGGHSADVVLWSDQGGQSYAPQGWDCTGQPGRYLVSKWSLKTCRLPPGVSPGRPEGE